MGLQVGLVGLPNVGKSTLFNALSRAGVPADNFPFCTIEPNVAAVPVPDPRLERVAEVVGSGESGPTTIEFVDVAGLVEGASRGEGLGNRFLGHLREVDAICHVVRCFDDEEVAHVSGTVDPIRDIEVVETELVLRDLATVQDRRDEARRSARAGDHRSKARAEVLEELHDHLARGEPARTFATTDRAGILRELFLLTSKPVLYAANVGEDDLPEGGERAAALRRLPAPVVVVSARIESEVGDLEEDERGAFLAALGLQQSGLERLVGAARRCLDLITFFTANEQRAQAWTLREGATAAEAAGKVHTDMERGFVRAEVVGFEDLDELGGRAAARDAGRLRLEGRDYVVRDGDLLRIRFTT